MGCEIWRPLIEDMTWSYSRIKSFDDCPYGWFLRYIRGEEGVPLFYSSFGSFVHELLAGFYRGELTRDEMKTKYIFGFRENVKGERPPGDVASNYFAKGLEYITNFEPLPFKILGVEEEVRFSACGMNLLGYIDLVGEDEDGLAVIDHKSRDLRGRSKRKKPTMKDTELDDMLRQLYIYSAAVEQKYGRLPAKLVFNCYRTGTVITEPFVAEKYDEAIRWAHKTVERLKDAEEFYPQYDFFKCRNLCDYHESCCYYEMMCRK